MKVITLAAGDSASVAAASQLVAAIRASALQGFGSELPTGVTSVASSLDLPALVQSPTLQAAAVPVLQAAASAAGDSWGPVAVVGLCRMLADCSFTRVLQLLVQWLSLLP